MAKYTNLNAQQIKQIGELYDFEINQYQPIDGGAANSSYLLSTPRGKYVLTVCDEKSRSQVEITAKLLLHLEKHNFPASGVVPGKDKGLVIDYEDMHVIMKKYIEGNVVEQLNESMLNQAGETLAKLHLIPSPEYLSNKHSYGHEMFSEVIGPNIDIEYETWLGGQVRYLQDNVLSSYPGV